VKIIYLCHPVKGATPEETDDNVLRAMRWVRWIYDWYPDVFVLAMWIVDCHVLDDANPLHRAAGMARNAEAIPLCHEGWLVGGEVSAGMADEVRMLFQSGKAVRSFVPLGPEPPQGPVEMPGVQVQPPQGINGWNLPKSK
jgi:hypothetical protein